MNSPDNVSQSGVIDLGLSDHDLIYCTRKTSLVKSHKHNDIFEKKMKRYSCVNDGYSDYIYRFVGAINVLAPGKKIRVKASSKPCVSKNCVSNTKTG